LGKVRLLRFFSPRKENQCAPTLSPGQSSWGRTGRPGRPKPPVVPLEREGSNGGGGSINEGRKKTSYLGKENKKAWLEECFNPHDTFGTQFSLEVGDHLLRMWGKRYSTQERRGGGGRDKLIGRVWCWGREEKFDRRPESENERVGDGFAILDEGGNTKWRSFDVQSGPFLLIKRGEWGTLICSSEKSREGGDGVRKRSLPWVE